MSSRIWFVAVLSVGALSLPGFAVAEIPAERPGGSFQDDNGNLHEPYLETLARQGILHGCSAVVPRVCPDTDLTRGQAASLLARGFGLEGDGQSRFSDVEEDGAHAAAIDAIADAGITDGCAPDRFCPSAPVTRAQFASMLAAALDLEPVEADHFEDVSGVHEGNINAVFEAGITGGCAPDLFCPSENVPRDQVATLLARSLDVQPTDPAAALAGSIAFVRDGAVWTAEPGGDDQQSLTSPPEGAADHAPRWSPVDDLLQARRTRDGSGMAPQLLIADATARDVLVVPDGDVGLWSPDGTHVLFERATEGGFASELVVVDSAASEERVVVSQQGKEHRPVGWSADGSEAYFIRTADDVTAATDLWAVDVDSGEQRRLTGPHDGNRFDIAATVSPDHDQIAFVRTDRNLDNADDQLVLVDPATGGERVLAERPSFGEPVWSADGTALAVPSISDPDTTDILLVAIADASVQTLATTGPVTDLAWSPDGQHILVRELGDELPQSDGRGLDRFAARLLAVAADASGTTPLTGMGDVGMGVWSPEGDWVLYAADHDGDGSGVRDIHQVRDDASDRFQVTAAGGDVPDWTAR